MATDGLILGASAPEAPHQDAPEVPHDYFVERDGQRFAGVHLLIDVWGAKHLDEMGTVERALHDGAAAAGATALHVHLKQFTENGGISGVLVLAESHISIHTWPERGFAALDIFTCGNCVPENAIPVFEAAFEPTRLTVKEERRGLGD